jgi:hypothetical protein
MRSTWLHIGEEEIEPIEATQRLPRWPRGELDCIVSGHRRCLR